MRTNKGLWCVAAEATKHPFAPTPAYEKYRKFINEAFAGLPSDGTVVITRDGSFQYQSGAWAPLAVNKAVKGAES
jgi:hypothetical protein